MEYRITLRRWFVNVLLLVLIFQNKAIGKPPPKGKDILHVLAEMYVIFEMFKFTS